MKIANISAQTIGLNRMVDGKLVQENIAPGDYRVVADVTAQMKHLADPTKNTLKFIEEDVYDE